MPTSGSSVGGRVLIDTSAYIWIAAAAIERAATLITFDAQFDRVRGLACEILSAGA